MGKIKKSKIVDSRWHPLTADVIPVSHEIINSRSKPQRQHIQTSYTNSKFNCCGVCYSWRQDRSKAAQSENEYIYCTYQLTVWNFPEISLLGLGFGPFRPLQCDSCIQKLINNSAQERISLSHDANRSRV